MLFDIREDEASILGRGGFIEGAALHTASINKFMREIYHLQEFSMLWEHEKKLRKQERKMRFQQNGITPEGDEDEYNVIAQRDVEGTTAAALEANDLDDDAPSDDNDRDNDNPMPLDFDTHMTDENSADTIVQSYEDLCRLHMKNNVQLAQQYAQETQLYQRVQDWQNKIVPFLDTQNQRAVFDVCQYGDQVLQQFPNDQPAEIDKPTLPFDRITEGRQSWEVARLFLATLQLANNGNVKLHHERNKINTLAVELLTKENRYRSLDEYLAPSMRILRGVLQLVLSLYQGLSSGMF